MRFVEPAARCFVMQDYFRCGNSRCVVFCVVNEVNYYTFYYTFSKSVVFCVVNSVIYYTKFSRAKSLPIHLPENTYPNGFLALIP